MVPAAAVGFKPEFLDFERGIRVGNLEDNERITRILKLALEARYRQPFRTERFGRGVYWQWIGYLPKANRTGDVSFGSSKFFLMVDREEKLFKCGLQVERGLARECRQDWDWHRLVKALKRNGEMERELERLLADGFRIFAGLWEAPSYFNCHDFPGALKLRRLLEQLSKNRWAGFQIFYAMRAEEVRASTGADLVDSILAVFGEVTPVMNLVMQVRL